MIQSKQDYKHYLQRDLIASGIAKQKFVNEVADGRKKFYKSLRKTEYMINCVRKKHFFGKIFCKLKELRHARLCNRYQWTIPPNVFGAGLAIVHRGTIVVSGCAKIGENCRIHVCVNIGSAAIGEKAGAPVLGDNVYIGPGAKLYGPIEIGDNTAIGANSVVNHSFEKGNCTIAGVPAKKISDKTSESLILK